MKMPPTAVSDIMAVMGLDLSVPQALRDLGVPQDVIDQIAASMDLLYKELEAQGIVPTPLFSSPRFLNRSCR